MREWSIERISREGVLTGTRASEDEEDGDVVVVECGGGCGGGLGGGGMGTWMVPEVERVDNVVNDGRHGNGWGSGDE